MAEEVLHPDYALVLVHPTPAVMPRARWLEVLGDYVVHSYAIDEQRSMRITMWPPCSAGCRCKPPSSERTGAGRS